MDKKQASPRNVSIDLLRIVSALSVVVLHVSGQYIMNYDVGSLSFRLSNFMNSVSRFGVPVFVMISGALFLSRKKEIPTHKIWLTYILRLLIVYGVWSFAYYVFQSVYFWHFDFWRHGIVRTVLGCVYASDHFWFLFMIMGLYAMVPFLRTWVQNASPKELDYFMILYVVFQILRETAVALTDKSLLLELLDMAKIIELSFYLGYFILGYIVCTHGVSKTVKRFLYVSYPIGVIVNFLVSDRMSIAQNSYSAGIYDSFGVFTFLHTLAIFVFFTDHFFHVDWSAKRLRFITNLSKDTLGIYLMHVGLLTFFVNEGILELIPSPLIGVPVISLLCFVLCGITAALLRRIPFIGKYIL